jgi:RHS repeat-associated protein
MTRPNGLKSIYAYDNLSRLQSVLHQSGSTTLDGAAYGVDNAGNRTSRTPQPAGTTTNFGYDNIYQLLSATQGGTTAESYTYDSVGNRLSSLGVSPYNNNSSNELTSIPGTTYTYDSNGNTQTKVVGSNTTTYAWDFENRMSSVTLPGSGGTVSFKYDPFGRRIYKSSSSGTSVYAYDGKNLIEETNGTGAVVARYAQGENIDEPLAMLRSGATSFYHADGLGNVTSLSNAAGALAQTYTFDSFGKQTASSGSLTNPFQYTARESDTETSLYYYRARYYDPSSGRFISEDPERFEGGIDFYRYVSNNSPNRSDPFGLSPCWSKLTITSVISCSAKFVNAKGMSCGMGDPPGAVQSLCDQLRKKIQDKGSADLDPVKCPKGECCQNMKTVDRIEPVNESLTITRKGCTVTFTLTGVFVGKGEVGSCDKCGPGGCK